MNEAFTIYKLIILYTLNEIESPLTFGLISDYLTGHEYTNYFNVQNAFAELLDADLIPTPTPPLITKLRLPAERLWNYLETPCLERFVKKLTNIYKQTITRSYSVLL